MAKKARKKRKPPQEHARSDGRYMTYVLLGLTAVVVGLTIHLLVKEFYVNHSGPPVVPAPSGPTQAEQVLGKAKELMRSGAYAPARDLMLAYVRLHPRDVVVRPLLAEAMWKTGRTGLAEHTVDDLLRLAKPTAQGLWLKGELVREREFREYSVSLASALWMAGGSVPHRRGSKHLHFFRRAAEADVGAGAEIWLKYALELLAADRADLIGQRDLIGRKEEVAEEYLNKALGAGLRDVRTLGSLGSLALKREDFERAAIMLSEATRQNAKDFRLWVMLAEAQKESGRQEQAADSIRRALGIRRSHETLMLKGQIDQLRRRYAQAAEAFAEAAADSRLRAQASFQAARCYYHLEKHALAMKYVDIAAELAPDDPNVVAMRTKIENARFGPPEAGASKGFRLTPEGTSETGPGAEPR